MRKVKRPEPVEVRRKRFEDRIADRRGAAERARAGGAAGIANDFALQARRAERELAALDRIPNQPIETPAGTVSVGDRIRVKAAAVMGAVGAVIPAQTPDHIRLNVSGRGKLLSVERRAGSSEGDELVEIEVLEIWTSGRIKTDCRLEGDPLGPMPIMIEPETVVEVLEAEGDHDGKA